ncbi:hypothetical protein RUM44_011486 [Polyplax serrata]|uniref:Uncharacterized protein n=1 Tax=Polyplax serrata TaxID=468196 RepID=A0ABR1AQ65_POLSC
MRNIHPLLPVGLFPHDSTHIHKSGSPDENHEASSKNRKPPRNDIFFHCRAPDIFLRYMGKYFWVGSFSLYTGDAQNFFISSPRLKTDGRMQAESYGESEKMERTKPGGEEEEEEEEVEIERYLAWRNVDFRLNL